MEDVTPSEKIDISFRPHFMDNETKHISLNRDLTVLQIVESLNIHRELYPQVFVQIGGVKIPQKSWQYVRPLPGAVVQVSLIPMGGGGGESKNWVSVIVGVVLIVAGALLSTVLGPAAGYMIYAGIGLVLGGAAGLLFPPPKPALSQSRYNNQESSQTYSLGSSGNAFKPFAPTIKLYGRHKFFPTICVKPYTQWNANNNDFYTVFDLGIGKVDRDNIEIRIGTTPISNFTDVIYRIIYWDPKNPSERFQIYLNDYETESFQVLIPTGGQVERNTKPDTEEFQVDIAFPQGLYSIDSNGNTLNETVEISIEYKSGGVWYNYSNAPKFDLGSSSQTTSINYPITIYNNKVTYEIKYFALWGNPYDTIPIWYTYYFIAKGSNFLRYSSSYIPQVGAKISINGANYTITGVTGTTHISFTPNIPNDIWLGTYGFFVYGSDSIAGVFNNPGVFKLTANKQNAAYFTLIVGGLPPAVYPIRIKKVATAGVGTLKHINEMYLAQIKSVKYKPPITTPIPHTFLEMKIKANEQLSGTLDNVSVISTSILPVWNGTSWVEKPTNNPAWILVDILTGPINGNPIDKNKLHLPSIVEWANFCDTLRTFDFELDGAATPNVTEKNAVCSFVMDFDSTVMQLINQVTSAGRATFSVIGGRYGVIIDRKLDSNGNARLPVQVLTERNYNNFSSARSYIKMPHALKVKFVDPESDWNISEQLVYNTEDGYHAGNSTLFESIDTFGCNTPSFAWRLGRYWMAQTRLRQEKITIDMDFENLVMLKGDLVDLQSQVMRVGGYPVRILQISGNTIFFDSPINAPAGTPGFEVRTRNIDPATGAGRIISGGIGAIAPDGLSVTVPDPTGMNIGDLFVFGIYQKTSIKCIVENIAPSDDLKATITLVEYAPEIFDADLGLIPPYNAQIVASVIDSVPPKILNAVLLEEVIHRNTQAYSRIDINLFVPPGAVWNATNVYLLDDFGNYQLVDFIAGASLVGFYEVLASENFTNIAKGRVLTFKFILVGNTGGHIPLTSADPYKITLKGDQVLPAAPDNLSMNLHVDTLLLTWDSPIGEPDVGAFVLRYSPVQSALISFNETSFFIDRISAAATSVKVAFRPGTYLLKTLDTSGNLSAADTRAIAGSPDVILTKNISTYVPEAALWPDIFADTVVVANELQLVQTTQYATVRTGYYYFKNLIDLGDIFTAKVVSFLQGYGLELGVFMSDPTWDPISQLARMNDVADDEALFYLEIRLTKDSFFLSSWVTMASINPISQGAVVWSNWRKIFSGEVTTRLIEFRIVLQRTNKRVNITPVVNSGKVTVEIPYTQRIYEDQLVPGTRTFVFDPQFWENPSLTINAQDLVQGDYYTVTNKSGLSFDLSFFDLNGTPVTRTADIQALGTGKRYSTILG